MRHGLGHRKLNRTAEHRKALFQNMLNSLIKYEQIKTTLPKAKELKPLIDKVITIGKKNNLSNKKRLFSKLQDKSSVVKVFDVLSSKYKLGRVRILLKEPRSTLSWHRDPEPRLHIPIITNPGAIMVVDHVAKHLPADGSVWITNNTKYHNAFNGGEENRIHLVACVLDYKFN